ncbi:hypothetical protein CBS101457_006871 [Exobasidium rhododendri]|nr:hypothetical protein CBS101457_006871 [Exobasidium rhododendri]
MSEVHTHPAGDLSHNNNNNNHHANGVSRTNGSSDEDRFQKLEQVVTAHGHALQTSQPAFPSSVHRKLALPLPLGSYCVGASTWFLGNLLVGTAGTVHINAWIMNGIPMGFVLLFLCGVGELFTGNTFGAALFLNVAAIILGLAVNFLPWAGIAEAFLTANPTNPTLAVEQINGAAGIYLLISFAVLFLLLIAAQRTAIAVLCSLSLINTILICFGIGLMTGSKSCVTTAGALFIVVSFNLFYNGTALLLLEVGHPFAKFMPLGSLAPKPKEHIA